MKATSDFFIRCNGTDVHITPADEYGPTRLDGSWGGEQCEGCGGDIAEHGVIDGAEYLGTVKGYARVRCGHCGSVYPVAQS